MCATDYQSLVTMYIKFWYISKPTTRTDLATLAAKFTVARVRFPRLSFLFRRNNGINHYYSMNRVGTTLALGIFGLGASLIGSITYTFILVKYWEGFYRQRNYTYLKLENPENNPAELSNGAEDVINKAEL